MPTVQTDKETCWFVMRDLKRPNAKLPAYKLLREEKFEVFGPMASHLKLPLHPAKEANRLFLGLTSHKRVWFPALRTEAWS